MRAQSCTPSTQSAALFQSLQSFVAMHETKSRGRYKLRWPLSYIRATYVERVTWNKRKRRVALHWSQKHFRFTLSLFKKNHSDCNHHCMCGDVRAKFRWDWPKRETLYLQTSWDRYNKSCFRVQILVSPPSLTKMKMKVKVRVMQAASYRGQRRNCRERKDYPDCWISRFLVPPFKLHISDCVRVISRWSYRNTMGRSTLITCFVV